jgi:hypothetical protein
LVYLPQKEVTSKKFYSNKTKRLTRDKHYSLSGPIMSNQEKVIISVLPRRLTRDKHSSLIGPIMSNQEKFITTFSPEGLAGTNTQA